MPKVYITGLGFITSIGNEAATVEKNLRELRHGMTLYPPFQKPEVPVKVAAPIKDFSTDSLDVEDWTYPARYRVKRDILRSMGPNAFYAWCAMQQAIEDARLGESDYSNDNTGLYAASGGAPGLFAHMLNKMHTQGIMRCSPMGIVAAIAGTVNFNLVATYKIKGSSTGFSSACASSSHALGFAYDDIILGRQKRMFVVGAEDGNIDSILPFAGMRALSLQTDLAKASRPFDAARDGFVGTGGAAVIVLESEDEVARRAVRPYCEVLGWGQASDGHNVAISHPDGHGLANAMRRALAASSLEPAAIDYINAHATSTPIGDNSEAKAVNAIFNADDAHPLISSTKALTGHGLSLAGAMETGFCALALRNAFLPGSAHITTIDPACAHLNILQKTESRQVTHMLNNSSGFGGANVSIVLKKA